MNFILFILSFTKSSVDPIASIADNELKNQTDERMIPSMNETFTNTYLKNYFLNKKFDSVSTIIDIQTSLEKIGKTKNINDVFILIHNLFLKENESPCDTSKMSYEYRKDLIDNFVIALFQHKDIIIENYHFLPELNLEDWVDSDIPDKRRKEIISELEDLIIKYTESYKLYIEESKIFIEFFKELISNLGTGENTKNETIKLLYVKIKKVKLCENTFLHWLYKFYSYDIVFKNYDEGFNFVVGYDIRPFLSENDNVYYIFDNQIFELYDIFGEILTGRSKKDIDCIDAFYRYYKPIFN